MTDLPFDLDDPGLVSAMDELPLWSAPFGLSLLDTVVYAPGLRVLDLGGGLGFPALELAQRLGPAARVVSLDPWAAGMARLGWKARQYRVAQVHPVRGSALRMPVADRSVDLITSNNGLNNVSDLGAAWRECRRVVRPGAQAVVTENLPGTMVEFYDALRETLRDQGLGRWLPAVEAHIHRKRKPLAETRDVVAGSGFRILSETQGRFTLRFADARALFSHCMVRIAFLPAWHDILPPEERERVFTGVAVRLDAVAARQGQVALTVPFVCLDCRRNDV